VTQAVVVNNSSIASRMSLNKCLLVFAGTGTK
jgi:hypothetical protein